VSLAILMSAHCWLAPNALAITLPTISTTGCGRETRARLHPSRKPNRLACASTPTGFATRTRQAMNELRTPLESISVTLLCPDSLVIHLWRGSRSEPHPSRPGIPVPNRSLLFLTVLISKIEKTKNRSVRPSTFVAHGA
jgi:hypothetical protein